MERRARRLLARMRRDRLIGLSSCHISPRYWAEVSPSGMHLGARSRGTRQSKLPPPGRGRISGFSWRSRARLLKLCSKISRPALSGALFLTLTYPSTYSADWCTWKRHLDSISKRIRRRYPRSSAIWKLEFQKRGAPHFHLMVFGTSYMAHDWIATAWYEVVGSHDERHRAAGIEVRRVHKPSQALAYAAKYVAKVSGREIATEAGRYWGVLGRESLPVDSLEWRLEQRGYERLARVIRNVVRRRPGSNFGGASRLRWVILDGRAALRAVCWADDLPIPAWASLAT